MEHGVWATRTSHCLIAWISAPPPALHLAPSPLLTHAALPSVLSAALPYSSPFYASATVPLLACPPNPNIIAHLLSCTQSASTGLSKHLRSRSSLRPGSRSLEPRLGLLEVWQV